MMMQPGSSTALGLTEAASLMNTGVAPDLLSGKLTTLGNIAAGAQMPLLDMVAIYAKAANKG